MITLHSVWTRVNSPNYLLDMRRKRRSPICLKNVQFNTKAGGRNKVSLQILSRDYPKLAWAKVLHVPIGGKKETESERAGE